jgi:hypothetical protein
MKLYVPLQIALTDHRDSGKLEALPDAFEVRVVR